MAQCSVCHRGIWPWTCVSVFRGEILHLPCYWAMARMDKERLDLICEINDGE